jgi:hypothetical protein
MKKGPNRKMSKCDRKYYVYVIRLKDSVLQKKKFQEANPDYKEGKPCYYVGSTSKLPGLRAEEHRTGARNKRGRLYSAIAMKYFDGLRPSKFKKYNPMSTRAKAENKELGLAKELRKAGYGIWCH